MAGTRHDIDIQQFAEIKIDLHVHGLRQFRFRMWCVLQLLKVIKLIAPKKVHVGLCGECSEEL